MLSQNDLQNIFTIYVQRNLMYICVYDHIFTEYLWKSTKETGIRQSFQGTPGRLRAWFRGNLLSAICYLIPF